jgi:hypothetical protein
MPVDIWMESVIQENSPTSATTLSPPLSESDSTGMVVPRIWSCIAVPFSGVLVRLLGRVLVRLLGVREFARAPVAGVLRIGSDSGPGRPLAYFYAAASRSRILETM